MFKAIRDFYHPPSEGQRGNRILGSLFFLSAVSLELSEHDVAAFAFFIILSFSFVAIGVWANDRINKMVMSLSLFSIIIYGVYLAYSNPS